MYDEESAEYVLLNSRFKKLIEESYPIEQEALLGMEISKDFNILFEKWRSVQRRVAVNNV
jgi:hypothetical protein